MKNLKHQEGKIYCFDPRKSSYVLMGLQVGKTLEKKVQTKHYMRVLDGYGIQYIAFIELESLGITKILIDDGTNKWLATTQQWLDHGRVADYGHGKQIFLSLKYMEKQRSQVVTEEDAKRANEIKLESMRKALHINN